MEGLREYGSLNRSTSSQCRVISYYCESIPGDCYFDAHWGEKGNAAEIRLNEYKKAPAYDVAGAFVLFLQSDSFS